MVGVGPEAGRRTTPFLNVSWAVSPPRWRAQMMHHGRRLHLGYYASDVEAAQAVAIARAMLPAPGRERVGIPVAAPSRRREAALRRSVAERLRVYGLGRGGPGTPPRRRLSAP